MPIDRRVVRRGNHFGGIVIGIAIVIGAVYLIWRSFIAPQLEMQMYPLGYTEFVERYADEYGLPSEIVYAVILIESSYKPDAQSHAGAKGLMQLTDDTYEWVAFIQREELEPERIFEPEQNIRRGCCLLAYLYREFGHWEEALAAYNAGIGRVRGWLADTDICPNGRLVVERVPIAETRRYISSVLSAMERYASIYFE